MPDPPPLKQKAWHHEMQGKQRLYWPMSPWMGGGVKSGEKRENWVERLGKFEKWAWWGNQPNLRSTSPIKREYQGTSNISPPPWRKLSATATEIPIEDLKQLYLNNICHSRRESGERRNDMIDIMLDCMKNLEESNGKKKMDEDNLIATAFVLLVAG